MQSIIKKKYGQDATNVGDEGGFAPNIQVRLIFFQSANIYRIEQSC
jgi:enolase